MVFLHNPFLPNLEGSHILFSTDHCIGGQGSGRPTIHYSKIALATAK